MSAAPQTVRIDIWSDVMCPWCAIGYGQLTKALDELDGEIAAEIRWRPFELNPDMPPEGEEQAAHLQRKYRRSAEETQAVRENMRAIARAAGVSLDYAGDEGDGDDSDGGDPPPAMMWNTFEAHRLLEWTLVEHGARAQTRLKLALLEAHFQHRRRIGERDVLLDIAQEAGLDRDAAAAALDDEELAAKVRAEERSAMDANITGVPAMVVNGKFLIPGAQAPDTYVNALRRIVSRRAAAL